MWELLSCVAVAQGLRGYSHDVRAAVLGEANGAGEPASPAAHSHAWQVGGCRAWAGASLLPRGCRSPPVLPLTSPRASAWGRGRRGPQCPRTALDPRSLVTAPPRWFRGSAPCDVGGEGTRRHESLDVPAAAGPAGPELEQREECVPRTIPVTLQGSRGKEGRQRPERSGREPDYDRTPTRRAQPSTWTSTPSKNDLLRRRKYRGARWGGSVGEASASGSGRDPGVLGRRLHLPLPLPPLPPTARARPLK